MVKYETLFIIKPDISDEEIQEVVDRLRDCVEQVGGKVAIVDHWGHHDMAYSIRYRGERLTSGYFVLMTYLGDGTAVDEVERNIKILDPTFRYQSIKLDANADPADVGELEVIHRESRRPRREERQEEVEDTSEVKADEVEVKADEVEAEPEAVEAEAEPGAVEDEAAPDRSDGPGEDASDTGEDAPDTGEDTPDTGEDAPDAGEDADSSSGPETAEESPESDVDDGGADVEESVADDAEADGSEDPDREKGE